MRWLAELIDKARRGPEIRRLQRSLDEARDDAAELDDRLSSERADRWREREAAYQQTQRLLDPIVRAKMLEPGPPLLLQVPLCPECPRRNCAEAWLPTVRVARG